MLRVNVCPLSAEISISVWALPAAAAITILFLLSITRLIIEGSIPE
jgi:hypothetical protein